MVWIVCFALCLCRRKLPAMARGNQRDLARAKNAKKNEGKGKGHDDGLTPLQRKERYRLTHIATLPQWPQRPPRRRKLPELKTNTLFTPFTGPTFSIVFAQQSTPDLFNGRRSKRIDLCVACIPVRFPMRYLLDMYSIDKIDCQIVGFEAGSPDKLTTRDYDAACHFHKE